MTNPFKWIGGHLALDFHNTVSWRGGEEVGDERFCTFADVLAWSEAAGTIDRSHVAALSRLASHHPRKTHNVFHSIRSLRRALRMMFVPLTSGRCADLAGLAVVNDLIATMPLAIEPTADGKCYEWTWPSRMVDLRSVLWPVLWSAGTLLNSEDVANVKMCCAEGCEWLYIDRSRRRNRRWCDMSDCGNRAKAKRFYERHRRADAGRSGE